MADDERKGDADGDRMDAAHESTGTGDTTRPHVLEEPGGGTDDREPPTWEIEDEPENPWVRGLFMVILALLFGVGEFILFLGAVLQFLWLVFAKEKNENIAAFGRDLADWLARVARYQTGSTDEKPFPFARWGAEE